MNYRREIDGLRALAVLPVILFHAGFESFSGGFVGVDVFFVISGYLITTIILAELQQGDFSIVNFYERRARRILPSLFLVMAASLVAGYFTLMPDEFKNLGQSLVATSLFSNNILLAVTSGYWDLASEFKPLLHTWSLGVEEQYYVIVPILLLLAWRCCKEKIALLLTVLLVGSFIFAEWFITVSSKLAFYILPARAWEIAIGALAATALRSNPEVAANFRTANVLSLVGLILVVVPVFVFDKTIPSPGWYLLVPTTGAVLIIMFSVEGSVSHLLLGHRIAVFIGLLSYSLYLWHQPIFAFLRICFVEKPSQFWFSISIIPVFVLSYLSWRFIETFFRDRRAIKRKSVFLFSLLGSGFFIACGLYLNKSYGLPLRVFEPSVRIEDMDKRIYNEKAFTFKLDSFDDQRRKKLLIIGDSFARDFTNITLETYDTTGVEMVYRDDLRECVYPYKNVVSENLFSKADIIVFASGRLDKACLGSDLVFALENSKRLFYVGTKDFGSNLNWIIRLKNYERRNRYNVISRSVINADAEMSEVVPSGQYISLLAPTLVSGAVPITDGLGRMISTDRTHLTKYGAIYFGQKAVKNTSYSDIFR